MSELFLYAMITFWYIWGRFQQYFPLHLISLKLHKTCDGDDFVKALLELKRIL